MAPAALALGRIDTANPHADVALVSLQNGMSLHGDDPVLNFRPHFWCLRHVGLEGCPSLEQFLNLFPRKASKLLVSVDRNQ